MSVLHVGKKKENYVGEVPVNAETPQVSSSKSSPCVFMPLGCGACAMWILPVF